MENHDSPENIKAAQKMQATVTEKKPIVFGGKEYADVLHMTTRLKVPLRKRLIALFRSNFIIQHDMYIDTPSPKDMNIQYKYAFMTNKAYEKAKELSSKA